MGNVVPIPVRRADMASAALEGTPLGELLDDLAKYADDPEGFVEWAFPWGQVGTQLEKEDGPEDWQRDQLRRIGEQLRAGGDLGCVIKEDVTSGHGVGKSALVGWIILWAISTREDTRGAVTANTGDQLSQKTWAELGKWYSLFIARSLFKFNATSIVIANDLVREKKWRIDAATWSANNTEAFAGLHNKGGRVLVIFDEASGIDDAVWTTTEGVMTDAGTQIIWLRYGNPTRTSGAFHKHCTDPKRSHYARVDSRTVRFTNKTQITEWIEDYGEDSDFVRVRVKGMFPRAGFANFISPELVAAARRRDLPLHMFGPYQIVLSVDPARFGDDFSVISLRQGLKLLSQAKLYGFDGPDLCARVVDIVRSTPNISCIVYDAIGNGADFDSAIRRVPNLTIPLIPVMWGVPAKDNKQYFNQRSECWGTMRDWLEHAQIPDDDELAEQLTSLDFGYDEKFRIQLQSKKDIKKNGGKSPDCADSLALSFIPELIDRKVVTAKKQTVRRRTVIWTKST